MSDDGSNDNTPTEQPVEPADIPGQDSPQDTSNWEDRPMTTPSDRIVIESFDSKKDDETIISE